MDTSSGFPSLLSSGTAPHSSTERSGSGVGPGALRPSGSVPLIFVLFCYYYIVFFLKSLFLRHWIHSRCTLTSTCTSTRDTSPEQRACPRDRWIYPPRCGCTMAGWWMLVGALVAVLALPGGTHGECLCIFIFMFNSPPLPLSSLIQLLGV